MGDLCGGVLTTSYVACMYVIKNINLMCYHSICSAIVGKKTHTMDELKMTVKALCCVYLSYNCCLHWVKRGW